MWYAVGPELARRETDAWLSGRPDDRSRGNEERQRYLPPRSPEKGGSQVPLTIQSIETHLGRQIPRISARGRQVSTADPGLPQYTVRFAVATRMINQRSRKHNLEFGASLEKDWTEPLVKVTLIQVTPVIPSKILLLLSLPSAKPGSSPTFPVSPILPLSKSKAGRGGGWVDSAAH